MLSSVELNERVRSLKLAQRLGYSLGVAAAFVLAYLAAMAVGIVLAVLLVLVVSGGPLVVPDDILAMALPIFVIFTFAVGMAGLGTRESAVGQPLGRVAGWAMRGGFLAGLAAGMVFGVFWSVILQANPLLFAAIIGLAVAPAFALFRGMISIIEPLLLKVVGRA